MSSQKWIEENVEKRRAYRRAWYKRNSERAKARVAERRKELKEWLVEYKADLKCSVCGEDHVACIEFHHLDPDKKEVNIGHAIHNGWGLDRVQKEIDKCQVVCANCHRKIHWQERQNE